MKIQRFVPISIGLGIFSDHTFAHTLDAGHLAFTDGFVHPFLGVDHVLAMIAVGLWAAQLGGAALWRVPSTFLLLMIAGTFLANTGLSPVFVDTVVITSVLIFGLVIASAAKIPLLWSTVIVAVFAFFHGYAHGMEMPESVSPWSYIAGFTGATGSLHAVGLFFGLSVLRQTKWIRLGGAAVAAIGAFLLASAS